MKWASFDSLIKKETSIIGQKKSYLEKVDNVYFSDPKQISKSNTIYSLERGSISQRFN